MASPECIHASIVSSVACQPRSPGALPESRNAQFWSSPRFDEGGRTALRTRMRHGASASGARCIYFGGSATRLEPVPVDRMLDDSLGEIDIDRKSTRLNSSHVESSYAVFCLKKKNNNSI